jgi:dihydroorotate dehydrogenase (fumarate)
MPPPYAGAERRMHGAGAAALKLNIYLVPVDPPTRGRDLEDRHLEILYAVKDRSRSRWR